jgi:hypothetical protein
MNEQEIATLRGAVQALREQSNNERALATWRYRAEELMRERDLTADQFREIANVIDMIDDRC